MNRTKNLSLMGMYTALICLSTLLFKIPIPAGYAHLGNAFILLAAAHLDWKKGMICAAAGSVLADILGGYYLWIVPTCIIKALMVAIKAVIAPNSNKINSMRMLLFEASAMIIMVLGYFIFGIAVMGSIQASITQLPGLVGEGIVGIIIFNFIGSIAKKKEDQ